MTIKKKLNALGFAGGKPLHLVLEYNESSETGYVITA